MASVLTLVELFLFVEGIAEDTIFPARMCTKETLSPNICLNSEKRATESSKKGYRVKMWLEICMLSAW